MAEFPALPLWTDAYLADTGHLTTLEHGSYLLLLITMWRNGGTLPNDDRKLARFARLTPGQWRRIRPTIMEFFQVDGDTITQGRLTDELIVVRQRSRRQSDNARAKYRKNKHSPSAMGVPQASHSPPPISRSIEDDDDPRARAREDDIPFDRVDETDRLLAEIGKATGIDIGKESDPRGRLERWVSQGLTPEAVLEEVRAVMRRKGNGRGPPKSLAYFDQAMQDAADHRQQPERRQPTTGGTNDRSGPARKSREQRAREAFEADLEFARSLDRGDQPAPPGDGDGPDDG